MVTLHQDHKCLESTQQGLWWSGVSWFPLEDLQGHGCQLGQRKAHFSTHVFAFESIFTFSKTHLPPSPCIPAVSLGTPPRSSPLDSVSRVCLLSSPGQMVPASSAEGAAAQSALQWPGCPLSQR